MAKVFYAPRDIKFTRPQVLWLIRNLPTLREGYWPKEESSYVDIPMGKKAGKSGAYFTKPIEYAAEIESRLERAGIDGLILEAIECWDKSVASLASYLRVAEWVIIRRRRRALNYIVGWKRRVK